MNVKAQNNFLTIIKPSRGWISINFKELWQYKGLLYFLIWRDIKVRYKQTVIGVAWVVFQPLLTMVVFSVLFGQLAKLPSEGIPYPIFTFTALLPWQLFAYAISQSADSLVANKQLITKIYFPRLIIPISAILSGLLDFGVSFLILIGLMFYYQIFPSWAILTLPFFVVLLIATAFSVGLWLSALNVRYRDVRYAIPFLIQLWFFISPVAYSTSIIPEKWQFIFGINPMVGVIEGFRWALLGKEGVSFPLLIISTAIVFIFLLIGLFYFRRMEKTFADLI